MSSNECNSERFILEVMLYSEDMGLCQSLHAQVEHLGPRIMECNDQTIRNEFIELSQRLKSALRYEAKHGVGSMLNLSHPAVRRQVRHGGIAKNEANAAAARARCPVKKALTAAVHPAVAHPAVVPSSAI